jgi:hypothetical protein
MEKYNYPWDGNEAGFINIICKSGNGPNVTICTPETWDIEAEGPFPHIPENNDFLCAPNTYDNWVDVYVMKLTAEVARKALTFINHCQPDEIDFTK